MFDANIFLTGVDFNYFPERIFTTPEIVDELKVERYIIRNRNIIRNNSSMLKCIAIKR